MKRLICDSLVADATMFRQSVNGPHSLALATLGMFFLWIGWFGFNGGSELALADESREHLSAVGRILVNTLLAGCAGGAVATIMSALVNSLILVRLNQDLKLSLDLEHTLNGVLGGLVAVTACCDLIPDPIFALLIGAAAGVIVVLVVSAFDTQFRIDDPVGAFAVHGACGVFGTLACALFGKSLLIQLLGAVSLSAWSFTVSFCLFYILNLANILRVSEHDEILGLDRSYHGKSAYHIE
jgi:Amt family ammonium transporter